MKINYHLFDHPVDLDHALIVVAGQENHDGPEYDLMILAADYIRELELVVIEANEVVKSSRPANIGCGSDEMLVPSPAIEDLRDALRVIEFAKS
jgi:hypothetical protein